MSPLTTAAAFWHAYQHDRDTLDHILERRYPLMPAAYVRFFTDGIAPLVGDPSVLSNLDADLGAVERAHALLDSLEQGGYPVKGARVLDIGCSNGALLLAAIARGGTRAVGVDTSADRLRSATMVCEGTSAELIQGDVLTTAVSGPFDLITCLDVLEHAPDWPALIARMGALLAPHGVAFVSLHNAQHPRAILAEPHYGIPGLVGLERARALACWPRIRSTLGITQDYDVHHWPTYAEIQKVAESCRLSAMPWVNRAAIQADKFWRDYRETWKAIEREGEAALGRLALPAEDAAALRGAVHQYGIEWMGQHARFIEGLPRSADETLAFYVAWYAHPTNALLRRATRGRRIWRWRFGF
jgi:2-polyprenyl-3-methyl-5-hydroxy-6-metoxy-1,4-benzoquinol methylase